MFACLRLIGFIEKCLGVNNTNIIGIPSKSCCVSIELLPGAITLSKGLMDEKLEDEHGFVKMK